MKRQIIFGTMLSAVIATGVAAQQPPAGTSGQTGTRPGQPSDSAQTMTVAGCLQAAAAPGTPSASSAGSPATGTASPSATSSGGFVLTNAAAGPMAGGSSTTGTAGTAAGTAGTGTAGTGTSGTTSSPGGSMSGTTYRLLGGENLQQYVGQKVEVTGSLAARGMSTPSGSPTGSGTGTGTTAGTSTGASATGSAAGTGAGSTGASGSMAAGAGQGMAGQAFQVKSVRPTGERCGQ